jgi:hypothetical protein
VVFLSNNGIFPDPYYAQLKDPSQRGLVRENYQERYEIEKEEVEKARSYGLISQDHIYMVVGGNYEQCAARTIASIAAFDEDDIEIILPGAALYTGNPNSVSLDKDQGAKLEAMKASIESQLKRYGLSSSQVVINPISFGSSKPENKKEPGTGRTITINWYQGK